ncbi:sigma-70 family RNA polymerase sigma factor [Caldifermentibacillus hisashii]|uniref:sigma-70 family RNA polymerase sigma factor n=1 Tax=Caldifermentibacillus hisashii TaxID=996558 RepID=UPI002E06FBEA|nr:sigma-70 family RNA polymerase sigma factor [Caldifermentibacillus hisashii]
MKEKEKFTFEEIFQQNEKRIYYHMHKLGIRDPDGEFYSEGLFALWNAYKRYESNKGPLSTYFNYTIRNRLIDLLRKKLTVAENEANFIEKEISTAYNGNKYGDSKMPIIDSSGIKMVDDQLWNQAYSILSKNQKKWLYYYIVRDMSIKEIAEKENVTVEAVKSWGKEARKKLKNYLK